MANIDSKYDSFIHFTIKFNSKDYSISFFREYSRRLQKAKIKKAANNIIKQLYLEDANAKVSRRI